MMKPLHFLSIQSCVSYGHVGNSAVTFPLQRLGAVVWPIHTVLFSNHTGYGVWRGQVMDVGLVRELLLGLGDRGALAQCQALLSGYMGSVELGQVILEAQHALPKDALYCCDPVMGDEGRGFFVPMSIADFFKYTLIHYAHMITPNHFEFEFIVDQPVDSPQDVLTAARRLFDTHPRLQLLVITSLRLNTLPADVLCVAAIPRRGQAYVIQTPRLDINLNGTGDLTSALCSYFYLKSKKNLELMLRQAISRVFSIIYETVQAGSRELKLVEFQNQLINPSFGEHFPVVAIEP